MKSDSLDIRATHLNVISRKLKAKPKDLCPTSLRPDTPPPAVQVAHEHFVFGPHLSELLVIFLI